MKTAKCRTLVMAAMATVAFLLGMSSPAHALSYSTTIGGASCLTCFGSVYTLNVQDVGSGGGNTTYNVTYSVDTSGYTGAGTGLDAIAFKIATFNNIVAAPSVAGVASFLSPALLNGLNANGCSGGGNSGFICSFSSNTAGVAVPNGTYTFNLNGLVLKSGSLFTDVTNWSIKALYVNANGQQRGITSENGVVPVPGTLLLFGLGFAVFAGWHRGTGRAVSHRSE